MRPKFFATPDNFRAWFEGNHDREVELWVGFHKRNSGVPSITWPESVDVALCFGWIDGVRKSIDEAKYMIRFTPRRASSKWSAVNLKRIEELKSLGLVHASGLKALAERIIEKPAGYSYEQRHQITLDPMQEKLFRANKKAWAFFENQAKWYRKTTLWWVTSAKKEETRLKRLKQLIEDSGQERWIAGLNRERK
jgi:uncharacterized protein YdeI (YjbR/CyaY-like superfamily)